MSRRRWDRWFGGAFVLFVGALLGGIYGLIQLFSAEASHEDKVRYISALVVTAVLAIVCGLAALAIKSQRDDSVGDIADDVSNLLKAYDQGVDELGSEEA